MDNPDRPAMREPVRGPIEVDLLVVGGGFTGLWTALRAVERDPGRSVLVIEADRIAEHASGRNGGICVASLTHGAENGRARWPDEFDAIEALGNRNWEDLAATIDRYGIDCGFVRGPGLAVATRPHEVDELEPHAPGFLDADAVRRHIDSPTFLAGRVDDEPSAVLDPARLAWGLAAAAEQGGARIAEASRLVSLERAGGGVEAVTTSATIRARHVALGTNVFRNPLRRLRLSTVPVYDHVLATEPLSEAQLASTNWDPGVNLGDLGNRFHYSRITPDRRILWGGFDAIYHYGRSIDARHEDRPETFELLAEHFAETFPQLRDLRFTHRWAGAIDTSTSFCAFYGTALSGRAAYALGFTGLGVATTRFAADVVLDLLSGEDTERTGLTMVRRPPPPFPPEPLASLGIGLTRWSLARHDDTGRRNRWLRALDRLGLGFDS
ncbi:MAG: FAD-binding oxidoreductase [Actinomycetota bacterium]|nr:FAD-binding oxidoreductase [Actinomycetota bacterium]